MKQKRSFSQLLLVASLLAAAFAQADGDSADTVISIEVNAARDYVARHDDAVILDVRTPLEYEMSHIKGSVNVDVQDESFADRVEALDPDKTYIVHCTKNPAGGRSSRALETLQSLGFKRLYSLQGGYVAWQEADLPLTQSSD